MKRICVFCGSSFGSKPEYSEAAKQLGSVLAGNDIGLVYGGANVGIMGQIANTVLDQGGEVVGVIPRALVEKEVAHTKLNDLRIVDSMHERKALMSELSDGFIAMPGGFGTIEEFVEILTWLQLGIHQKPCGLLNVNMYYDKFMRFLDHITGEQFVQEKHRNMVLADSNPKSLIEKFETFQPPAPDKTAWAQKMTNNKN
ncbi:MAG: TIGR00730 family Rossman fold protein [Desulfobacteraceae bacterium]|nr:TIGR00730 family Rossman fold protein [Desulfobacteraceae bacterium]